LTCGKAEIGREVSLLDHSHAPAIGGEGEGGWREERCTNVLAVQGVEKGGGDTMREVDMVRSMRRMASWATSCRSPKALAILMICPTSSPLFWR